MNRNDRHNAEREWRATPATKYRQHVTPQSGLNWLLLVGVFMAGLLLGTGAAHAQSYEAGLIQQDRGWHGVGGDLQIHEPTVDARANPIIATWQRVPVPAQPGQNPYGRWHYAKVLYGCDEGLMVVYAVLDGDEVRTIRELTGRAGLARTPTPGGPDDKAMRAVCSLYGYTL